MGHSAIFLIQALTIMQFATASQPYYPPITPGQSTGRHQEGCTLYSCKHSACLPLPLPLTVISSQGGNDSQGGGDRLSQLAIKCPSTTQANGLQDRRWCTAEQWSHCVVHARHHLFNRPWPALAKWTGPLVDKTPGQQRPLYRRKRLSRKRLSEFNRLLGGEQPVCYMLGQML